MSKKAKKIHQLKEILFKHQTIFVSIDKEKSKIYRDKCAKDIYNILLKTENIQK